MVQDRQKRFISRNTKDQEKSKHSKSDPGPQKRNSREYRQRNRSLSKGQKTLHTLVVQYRVPVARQRFTCGTPHKHGVPASRLSELIARRTYYRMATAMKEKLQSGYHQSSLNIHLLSSGITNIIFSIFINHLISSSYLIPYI